MTLLPEVEVLRKDLERDVVGKRIREVVVRGASVIPRYRTRPEFVRALVGRKIEALERRGVHLVFRLDGGQALVVRCGVQALLVRETASSEPGRHTQVVATFTTGGAVHYVAPERDGDLFVIPADDVATLPEVRGAGIDPLSETFTWPAFSAQLKAHPVPLRSLLLDDSFVVGLGDVYADEILWAAGVAGTRLTTSLSSSEVRRLYRSILEVLHDAVKHRSGDSIGAMGSGPGSADGDPNEDLVDEVMKVWGREGRPCARCRQPIVHRALPGVGGGPSYHCPQCQT